jgi:hypothetical protein
MPKGDSISPVECDSGFGNIMLSIEGDAAVALLTLLKANGRDKQLKEMGINGYSSRDGKLVCVNETEGARGPLPRLYDRTREGQFDDREFHDLRLVHFVFLEASGSLTTRLCTVVASGRSGQM